MRILIINGPNINMIGQREPDIYGHHTYLDLEQLVEAYAKKNDLEVKMVQSNYEGELVSIIQDGYGTYDYYIINPAAYTHTSVAILDALLAVNIPTIEVHLSEPLERESFRHVNLIESATIKRFAKHGIQGYIMALEYIGTLAS